MESAFILTIDGPAASGKSSVSRELGKRLGFNWVSTGVFYRGLAYVAHQEGVPLNDEPALVELALHGAPKTWSVQMKPEQTCFFHHGVDVTEEIGRESIGTLASRVSSLPQLRKALLDAQRQCAMGLAGLIAEGRDCGTVVFPKAQVKIFLTARAEDRAARRAKDEGADPNALIDEQKRRDAQDASRSTAPMQASVDSYTIDTTELTLLEVVEQIERLVRHNSAYRASSSV